MRAFIFFILLVFGWVVSQSIDDEAAQWVGEVFRNYTGENVTVTTEVNLNPVTPETELYCTMANNQRGVCVMYYLCDPDSKSIISDGTTLIDIRERTCPHYLEVCCLENKRIFPTADDEVLGNNAGGPSVEETRPSGGNTTVLRPQAKASCGWSGTLTSIFKPGVNMDDRIIADFGEFPWMIAVLVKNANRTVWSTDDYRGGGALIHPAVVLTAAHTVNTVNQTLKCRAGEWDTQTTREQFPFQERTVTDRRVHPKYSRQSLLNDFALLFLERPFELAQAPHIGVACVARDLPPPGTVCYGMGWGKNVISDTYAITLKKVRQTLVSKENCTSALREPYGPFYNVHKSLTCALGSAGQDTCRGDGGSPLVCPIQSAPSGERRYVVAALVAYGVECGLEGLPAVYANVPQARTWINTVMAERGHGALEDV